MDQFKIYLFGPFAVKGNGRQMSSKDWYSKKSLILFKYLVSLEGKKVAKEVLIELLWPESTSDQLANLHTTIHYIRKALRNFCNRDDLSFINYEKGYYWFDVDQCWLDYREFKRLINRGERLFPESPAEALKIYNRALSLYSGDFLADELYEEWALARRQYYRELYIDTVLKTSNLFQEIENDYQKSLTICLQGLETDPYREDLHYTVISNLIITGNYMEAVMRYKKYSAILHKEGLTPGPEIRKLMNEINNNLNSRTTDFIKPPEESTGPLVCDSQTFELIFDLGIRRQNRVNDPFALINIDLNIMDNEEAIKEIILILQTSLRRGDVICIWENNRILVNIFHVQKMTTNIIRRRIKNQIEKKLNINLTIESHIIDSSEKGFALHDMII